MSAFESTVDGVERAASNVARVVTRAVAVTVGVGALALWTAFWLYVVRLHYAQGAVGSAAATLALMVAAPLGAALWYVGERANLDVLPGDVDSRLPTGS